MIFYSNLFRIDHEYSKYTVTISACQNVDNISLQPDVQVLTREPKHSVIVSTLTILQKNY